MRCDNVHTSRLVREESCSRLILFTFGKERVRKVRPGCKVLNGVLPGGAVLALVAGITMRILVLSDGVDMDSFNLPLYVGLLVASAVLHELAHLWAAISYGFPVFEAGVLVEILAIGPFRPDSVVNGAVAAFRLQGTGLFPAPVTGFRQRDAAGSGQGIAPPTEPHLGRGILPGAGRDAENVETVQPLRKEPARAQKRQGERQKQPAHATGS